MRYIDEGEEETAEVVGDEPAAVAESEAPQELAAEAEPEQAEPEEPAQDSPVPAAALDTQAVDKKLEETTSAVKDTPVAASVETPAAPTPAAEETASKSETEAGADAAVVAQEVAEEEVKKPDVPKEPSPTPAPAATPARTPAPEPEKPKGPPKPMTWASRIAAAAGPTTVKPVVPLPAKTAAAPAQPRAAPAAAPAAAATPAAAQPSAPAQPAENSAQSASKEANEWRTAGADTKKQSRQSAGVPTEKEGTLAYVKFVTEKVKDDDLRSALGAHGDLVYFDINRSKVSNPEGGSEVSYFVLTRHRTAPLLSSARWPAAKLPSSPAQLSCRARASPSSHAGPRLVLTVVLTTITVAAFLAAAAAASRATDPAARAADEVDTLLAVAAVHRVVVAVPRPPTLDSRPAYSDNQIA